MLNSKICIRRSGALGDVLMMTPIVRELSRLNPSSEIFVATNFPDVFRNSPYVASCIPADVTNDNYFTRVIDLEYGYELHPNEHPIDAYASIAGFDKITDKKLEIFTTHSDLLASNYFLRNTPSTPYLVIHISHHKWPNRNFREAFWGAIVSSLLKSWTGYIVQIGGHGDHFFEGHPRLINLVNKTSIHVSCELIKGACCFIGIDTGTLHLASCTETPIVGIFTCVKHHLRVPFRGDIPFFPISPDLDCYGCQASYAPPATGYFCKRGDNKCTEVIHPGVVVQSVLNAVNKTR